MESVLFSSGMNMWGEHHDRHSSDCTDDLSVRLDTANHLQQSLDLFQRGNLEMAERSLQIAHRNLLEIKQDSFFNIFKDRSFHCDVCNQSVWTNGWKEDILPEKIQDMTSAASVWR